MMRRADLSHIAITFATHPLNTPTHLYLATTANHCANSNGILSNRQVAHQQCLCCSCFSAIGRLSTNSWTTFFTYMTLRHFFLSAIDSFSTLCAIFLALLWLELQVPMAHSMYGGRPSTLILLSSMRNMVSGLSALARVHVFQNSRHPSPETIE